MMGVAPVRLGIASFHAMFSVLLQRTGRFFSVLVPFRNGPRHCGQFSANADKANTLTHKIELRMQYSFTQSTPRCKERKSGDLFCVLCCFASLREAYSWGDTSGSFAGMPWIKCGH